MLQGRGHTRSNVPEQRFWERQAQANATTPDFELRVGAAGSRYGQTKLSVIKPPAMMFLHGTQVRPVRSSQKRLDSRQYETGP